MIPPHLAQGTRHSQADPCPASLQFGVFMFLGPQKSPPGLVWGPHRATVLIFKGLNFPQRQAWPRPGPGEQARATPRAPLPLVLWSRLSLSLSQPSCFGPRILGASSFCVVRRALRVKRPSSPAFLDGVGQAISFLKTPSVNTNVSCHVIWSGGVQHFLKVPSFL